MIIKASSDVQDATETETNSVMDIPVRRIKDFQIVQNAVNIIHVIFTQTAIILVSATWVLLLRK